MNCEFYPFCLDREVEVRKSKGRAFEETEIWYLLYAGLLALASFENTGKNIGNIGPINILMNKRGHIRYVSKYTWPN